jgi:hypothetical protein
VRSRTLLFRSWSCFGDGHSHTEPKILLNRSLWPRKLATLVYARNYQDSSRADVLSFSFLSFLLSFLPFSETNKAKQANNNDDHLYTSQACCFLAGHRCLGSHSRALQQCKPSV